MPGLPAHSFLPMKSLLCLLNRYYKRVQPKVKSRKAAGTYEFHFLKIKNEISLNLGGFLLDQHLDLFLWNLFSVEEIPVFYTIRRK